MFVTFQSASSCALYASKLKCWDRGIYESATAVFFKNLEPNGDLQCEELIGELYELADTIHEYSQPSDAQGAANGRRNLRHHGQTFTDSHAPKTID